MMMMMMTTENKKMTKVKKTISSAGRFNALSVFFSLLHEFIIPRAFINETIKQTPADSPLICDCSLLRQFYSYNVYLRPSLIIYLILTILLLVTFALSVIAVIIISTYVNTVS